jgi:hypothetical protein
MPLSLRQDGFFIQMEEKLLENPQPQSSFAIEYSSNAIALGYLRHYLQNF